MGIFSRLGTLIKSNIKGPAILTGGSFGLESSIIAFLLCTATGIVLLFGGIAITSTVSSHRIAGSMVLKRPPSVSTALRLRPFTPTSG